ncbi:MAG: 30S ribosomal protein S5 [Patescibacteria group bacterium]
MSDVEPTIKDTTEAGTVTPRAAGSVPAPQVSAAKPVPARAPFGGRRARGGGRGGQRTDRGGRRGSGQREERARPEFDQKMLQVRRVARVVAGGRRFNFSVLVVVGNRKGAVGVGLGKAGDTALAIEKATRHAKKHLVRFTRTGNNSIPHTLEAKYSSARIVMFPAKNKGLIAGSAVRSVLELAGITDVNAKVRSGSKNKLNIARATIAALQQLQNQNVKSKEQNEPAKS